MVRNEAIDKLGTLTGKKIRRIRRRLLCWGRLNFQKFPWRSASDGWLTLVVEIFLQRTRASQVAKVYEEFCAEFPTPAHALAAGHSEISRSLNSLGLAFRTNVVLRIARSLIQRQNRFPESLNELTAIKGIGPYTAAAWLSLHRGRRAALIDSNISRWLSRLTGSSYYRDPRGVAWIKELAETMTPRSGFREYNYAILDFTMLICQPRRPKCNQCPIQDDCSFPQRRSDNN